MRGICGVFCALWFTLFEIVQFLRACAKKKAAHKRRPESREETPKKASAASLPHCNNDSGINFVQRKRRAECLPLFFADVRDLTASLLTACIHRSDRCRRAPHQPGHGHASLIIR
jgi:hypothetical protein